MGKTITSYGTKEGVLNNVLMSNGATEQDKNGRFYVDGQMVGVSLAETIIEAIYLNNIFVPGFNCTGKYTEGKARGGAIEVPLAHPFSPSSRTLSYGGRKGTQGNDGIVNSNSPILPTTDEVMIYLNQVNDQDILFPDISKEYIPLDLFVNRIAGYGQSVAMDRSSSGLAELLAYNIYRSLHGGENIINFDGSADNAYADLISKLNAKFTNGDKVSGALTYPLDGRVVLCRPSFYGIFNKQSGVILNGSNLAQEMLRDYDLSVNINERRYVGDGYIGEFGRINFVVVPDQYFEYAEMYLGLEKGDLNDVLAIAYQKDCFATGAGIDTGVKLMEATYPNPRGLIARPLNIWGQEAIRKGILICKIGFSNDNLVQIGFSDDDRRYPIAPKKFEENQRKEGYDVPIYDNNTGKVIGYKRIIDIQTPSGGNYQSGLEHCANPTANPAAGAYDGAQNVTLTSATAGADIYYTDDGSTPTSASTKYTTPIAVAATKTLKAIAIKDGFIASDVVEFKYTIG